MEITCLGSGDAFSYDKNRNCFLVNDEILLDCPPEILKEIYGANEDPSLIETVFLSHLHADHYFGLPFLFLEYLFKNPKEKLQIIGPKNTRKTIKKCWRFAYSDPREFLNRKINIQYKEVEPGKNYDLGDISFGVYRMKHTGKLGEVIALGYKINFKKENRTIAYTGDTTYTENIYKLAKGVDLLIIDCSYPKDTNVSHIGFKKVKEIREKLPKSTDLILSHLSEVTQEMKEEEGIRVAEGSEKYKV